MKAPRSDRLLYVHDIAHLLRCSQRYVGKLIKSGRFPEATYKRPGFKHAWLASIAMAAAKELRANQPKSGRMRARPQMPAALAQGGAP